MLTGYSHLIRHAAALLMLVLGVAVELIRDAVEHLGHTSNPRSELMLAVSTAALVMNGINAWLLHGALAHGQAGHSHAHDHVHHDEHGHDHDPARDGHQETPKDKDRERTDISSASAGAMALTHRGGHRFRPA